MKVLLIVNPLASSVTGRTRAVIQKALSADHRLEVAVTNHRGHATRIAQNAAKDGIDIVVVLGGDGTLNEVANGLVGSETALAAIPGGSTNVFARTLGIPDDPIEATGVLLDSLEAGSTHRIGLGSVNQRYFLFHAGIGFDAAVVEQVEKKGGLLKRFAGHPLFVIAAIGTWLRYYDKKRPAFRISTRKMGDEEIGDLETTGVEGLFSVCLNTDPYTYLGTRKISLAPHANLDTPLAVVTFKSLTLKKLLPVILGALVMGKTTTSSSRIVDLRSDLTEAQAIAYKAVPLQVDGDFLGNFDEFSFKYKAECLDVVMPIKPNDFQNS